MDGIYLVVRSSIALLLAPFYGKAEQTQNDIIVKINNCNAKNLAVLSLPKLFRRPFVPRFFPWLLLPSAFFPKFYFRGFDSFTHKLLKLIGQKLRDVCEGELAVCAYMNNYFIEYVFSAF